MNVRKKLFREWKKRCFHNIVSMVAEKERYNDKKGGFFTVVLQKKRFFKDV